MRITRIDVAGPLKNGQKIPETSAGAQRRTRDEAVTMIDVVLYSLSGTRTHHVQADCDEDIRSMAECLQFHLDGYRGTGTDINEYYRELCRLAS